MYPSSENWVKLQKKVPHYAYKAFKNWSTPLKSPKLKLFPEIGHIKASQYNHQQLS